MIERQVWGLSRVGLNDQLWGAKRSSEIAANMSRRKELETGWLHENHADQPFLKAMAPC